MVNSARKSTHVAATVTEILPAMGLAYLTGDDHRSWAITKSTHGVGLDALKAGRRVELTVVHDPRFSIVSEYTPLD